jgi:hypothetical protein
MASGQAVEFIMTHTTLQRAGALRPRRKTTRFPTRLRSRSQVFPPCAPGGITATGQLDNGGNQM